MSSPSPGRIKDAGSVADHRPIAPSRTPGPYLQTIAGRRDQTRLDLDHRRTRETEPVAVSGDLPGLTSTPADHQPGDRRTDSASTSTGRLDQAQPETSTTSTIGPGDLDPRQRIAPAGRQRAGSRPETGPGGHEIASPVAV